MKRRLNRIWKPFKKFRHKGVVELSVNRNYFKKLNINLISSPTKLRKRVLRRSGIRRSIDKKSSIFFFKKSAVWSLVPLEHSIITEASLEMLRRGVRRALGKFVFIHLKAKALLPVYERAAKSRMGKGKANKFVHNIYHVNPGVSLIEMRGVHRPFRVRWLLRKMGFRAKWVLNNKL